MQLLLVPLFVLVEKLFAFFAARVGERAALATTLASVLTAGWIAAQVAALALWNAVGFTMPALMNAAMPVFWALAPSNLLPCITAVIGAKIGAWLWYQQVKWLVAVSAP